MLLASLLPFVLASAVAATDPPKWCGDDMRAHFAARGPAVARVIFSPNPEYQNFAVHHSGMLQFLVSLERDGSVADLCLENGENADVYWPMTVGTLATWRWEAEDVAALADADRVVRVTIAYNQTTSQ